MWRVKQVLMLAAAMLAGASLGPVGTSGQPNASEMQLLNAAAGIDTHQRSEPHAPRVMVRSIDRDVAEAVRGICSRTYRRSTGTALNRAYWKNQHRYGCTAQVPAHQGGRVAVDVYGMSRIHRESEDASPNDSLVRRAFLEILGDSRQEVEAVRDFILSRMEVGEPVRAPPPMNSMYVLYRSRGADIWVRPSRCLGDGCGLLIQVEGFGPWLAGTSLR